MSHQLRATWVVTRRELLRFKQDKARMVTMLLQPLLFIFVMGTGLGSIVDTGGGTASGRSSTPGVLATSVLFTAAFAGISLVWDREFGFLREMMVAPISRASIIWGKCLGGAIVATGQSLVLLALLGTVGIPYSPVLIAELIGCLFLGALLLTALGVLLSTRIKTIQAAMPVSQLLIMPMMFLSGSLFPITDLPEWLAVLTRLNPLTYVVQPMRHFTLEHLSPHRGRAGAAGAGAHLVRLAGAGRRAAPHGRRHHPRPRRRWRPGSSRPPNEGPYAAAVTSLAGAVWPELPEAPLLVVPLGSVEQHGHHLPLGTDTSVACAAAEAAVGCAGRRPARAGAGVRRER